MSCCLSQSQTSTVRVAGVIASQCHLIIGSSFLSLTPHVPTQPELIEGLAWAGPCFHHRACRATSEQARLQGTLCKWRFISRLVFLVIPTPRSLYHRKNRSCVIRLYNKINLTIYLNFFTRYTYQNSPSWRGLSPTTSRTLPRAC